MLGYFAIALSRKRPRTPMVSAMPIDATTTTLSELCWLSDVRESGPRLNAESPIWVRRFVIRSGPAMTHPECHPYCELGLHTGGSGVEFVGREKSTRGAGDFFLAGPGLPHWFKATRYPLAGIAIYFLPSVLCEMGPRHDGLHLLRRLTAKQDLKQRLIRPSAALRRKLTAGFESIHGEFARESLGREIRLRTLLMEMLVDLVRWEKREGKAPAGSDASPKWASVNLALHYLREHFAEPVYAHDVAKAVGVSESRLKTLFREALGVPWSRYIQGYRIQQAIALLGASDYNVTQAALAVGFDSPSHFNATFRAFMGVSPSVYLKQQPKTASL